MNIPKLRAPVVLVHGLFGFERLRLAGLTVASYFPGIPNLLQSPGNRVLVPALSPTAGIAVCAQELKDFINRESPQEPVHIIGHSLGGLDSRYMISCLGMADRVLTLTTLGTPHRGTSFLDWGVNRFERIVKPIFRWLGWPTGAFYDLTRGKCKDFNARVPDVPRVRYFSVAGQYDGRKFLPEWLLPHGHVHEKEGPNDGVVSVASATYGESVALWQGDHFSLVNWSSSLPLLVRRSPRCSTELYREIVCRLENEGY